MTWLFQIHLASTVALRRA